MSDKASANSAQDPEAEFATSDSPPAIEARGLVKTFGQTRAADGVDLVVPAGIVFGLLGRNGAGKTTTIRMLATLLPPDAGEARVFGHDIVDDAGAGTLRVRLRNSEPRPQAERALSLELTASVQVESDPATLRVSISAAADERGDRAVRALAELSRHHIKSGAPRPSTSRRCEIDLRRAT